MAIEWSDSKSRLIQIVDDDEVVRKSTSIMLRSLGYYVQCWVDGASFLKAAPSLGPSCVLLDLHMPGVDGLEVQRELVQLGKKWPIVFLSGTAQVPQAVSALQHGAVHFLVKPAAPAKLRQTLDIAFEQLGRDPDGSVEAQAKLARLSPREADVLEGLVEGLPNKSIAFDLGVSARTIEAHRAKIMRKLEANNFAQVRRTVFEARL